MKNKLFCGSSFSAGNKQASIMAFCTFIVFSSLIKVQHKTESLSVQQIYSTQILTENLLLFETCLAETRFPLKIKMDSFDFLFSVSQWHLPIGAS